MKNGSNEYCAMMNKEQKAIRKHETKFAELLLDKMKDGSNYDSVLDALDVGNKYVEAGGAKMPNGRTPRENMAMLAEAQRVAEIECKQMVADMKYMEKDKDPYGDGDQTIVSDFQAEKLKCLSNGFLGFYKQINCKLGICLSPWAKACYEGDFELVKKFLNSAKSTKEKEQLLEKRESMIRFCGLFHVIAGALELDSIPCLGTEDHIITAQLLLDAGARVSARDYAGRTPLHACACEETNSTTIAIAKILVEYGADVNAKNRGGQVVLQGCFMALNYDFIEFLVCKGANPNIADNDGQSCHIWGVMNPKINAIFYKGYRAQALTEKKKQRSELALVDTCDYCKTGNATLKKCTGCFSAAYCGRKCQTSHWKTHKVKCKKEQQENKKNVLVFHPVTYVTPDRMGLQYRLSYDNKTKTPIKVDTTACYTGIEKVMKIKVQAIVDIDGPMRGGYLRIRDKAMSYQTFILPSDEHFDRLFDLIVAKGFGGVKLYCSAELKENADLHINLGQTYPETW